MTDERFSPVGFTASGPRNIRDGRKYDAFFPQVGSVTDTLAKANGTVIDTVHTMANVIRKYLNDTIAIAKHLKADTLEETLKNDWNFVFEHIQYRLDDGEQIRRPAVSWKQRKSGVDCDCMTVFLCTILIHQGIDHVIRITNYDNKKTTDGKPYYQHVYIVVPLQNGDYYTVDTVVHKFDYEKPFTAKKDFTMEGLGIPIHVLHGIDNTAPATGRYGYIDEILNGTAAEPKTPEEMLMRLKEVRNYVATYPKLVSLVEARVDNLLKMLDSVIASWNTPERDRVLLGAAYHEALYNKALGITLAELDGNPDEDDFVAGLSGADDNLEGLIDEDDLPFDGLGNSRRKARRKQRRAARKARRKARRAKRKARRKGSDEQESQQELMQADQEVKQADAEAQPDPQTNSVPDEEKGTYPNQKEVDKQDAQEVDTENQQEADDNEEATDNNLEGEYIDGLGLSKAERKKRRSERRAERKETRKKNKEERKKAKGFFRKLKVGLKQGSKAAFIKFNPLIQLARGGFLLAVRLNMFKMASLLKWGYATDEQAKKAKVSPTFLAKARKAVKKTEEIFADKLGGSRSRLRQAVLSGKHGKLSGWTIGEIGSDYLDSTAFDGFGIAPAAPAIAAAASVIAAVVGAIKGIMKGSPEDASSNVQTAANTIQSQNSMTPTEMGMIEGFDGIIDQSIEDVHGIDGLNAVDEAISDKIYRQLSGLYSGIMEKNRIDGNLQGVAEAEELLGDLGKWKLFDKDRRDLRKQLKAKYGKTWKQSREWKEWQAKNGLTVRNVINKVTEAAGINAKVPVAIQSELKKVQSEGVNVDAEYNLLKSKGYIEEPSKGEGIFSKVLKIIKTNPVITTVVVAGAAYALIPPVRNFVNDTIGIKSKRKSLPAAKPSIQEKKLS